MTLDTIPSGLPTRESIFNTFGQFAKQAYIVRREEISRPLDNLGKDARILTSYEYSCYVIDLRRVEGSFTNTVIDSADAFFIIFTASIQGYPAVDMIIPKKYDFIRIVNTNQNHHIVEVEEIPYQYGYKCAVKYVPFDNDPAPPPARRGYSDRYSDRYFKGL